MIRFDVTVSPKKQRWDCYEQKTIEIDAANITAARQCVKEIFGDRLQINAVRAHRQKKTAVFSFGEKFKSLVDDLVNMWIPEA